jgi:non-ribosomal peptide synthetase component F
MTTVVPWMDPTRPARARPERLVQAIEDFGVSNVFGSPALLRVLSGYAKSQGIRLASVRRVISAGAAVPIETVRNMQAALPAGAKVFTPYGATECLPVASISGDELDERVAAHTDGGDGICVGRTVAPNCLAIMPVRDAAEDYLRESELLPSGVCGEIIVHGPTTTDAYWQRDAQTRLAKTTDDKGRLWHRMGDIGYLDADGRLWYCGYFNTHPAVLRTALVGAGGKAVLCVEALSRVNSRSAKQIRDELLAMARRHTQFRIIDSVLFHRGFPVDIRHNSKIGRERLARWAAGKLR